MRERERELEREREGEGERESAGEGERGRNLRIRYHDGGHDDSAVLDARAVVGRERLVLDQHQLVVVVPVANLSVWSTYAHFVRGTNIIILSNIIISLCYRLVCEFLRIWAHIAYVHKLCIVYIEYFSNIFMDPDRASLSFMCAGLLFLTTSPNRATLTFRGPLLFSSNTSMV